MANPVENLGKLKRRVTISLPKERVLKEVDGRLRQIAKNFRMPGFRPGKAPLKIVAQQHGPRAEAEVLSDLVGKQFYDISESEALRVAGQPSFAPKEDADQALIAFDATFEVYPEIAIGDLSTVVVKRPTSQITDAEVENTLEILRKQRTTYEARDAAAGEVVAQDGDRLTLDFVGRLDGEVFEGGSATDFTLTLGEGRMLADFESALKGQKLGEEREFDVKFPDDYQAPNLAGKTARFSATLKKVEAPQVPELDQAFAKSLGVADGDLEKMRADIRDNLEREAKRRLQELLKERGLQALAEVATFDLPEALVEQEQERLAEGMRAQLEQRGIPNPTGAPLPLELFKEQAEKRVRLGLAIGELVKEHKLDAKPEQIRADIEELAKSYEDPKEVVRWFYSNPQQLAERKALVVENNVVEFIVSQAKVEDEPMSFEELASSSQRG